MTGSFTSLSSTEGGELTNGTGLSNVPTTDENNPDAAASTHGFRIEIESTLNYEEFILYVIRVSYKYASWTVRRRYKEFCDLHQSLSKLYAGIERVVALPGKKMIGNFSQKFVNKRQKRLEQYLINVLTYLKSIPKELAFFLDMQKYELNWIVHVLSENIFSKTAGYNMLSLIPEQYKTFHLDTLQLHAIYKRMSLEVLPDTYEMTQASVNLAHLMDFAFNLRVLKVEGRHHRAGSSNWKLNEIPFSLYHFKSLKHLQLECVNLSMIGRNSFDGLQQSLVNLHCHKSISTCSGILNPTGLKNAPVWQNLIRLNLSKNRLTSIDESMCGIPKLQFLDLSHNKLNCIQNLVHLSQLRELDLSFNNFSYLEDVHAKLGNIRRLRIDNNKLFSLDGLSKMYSIEHLSCTGNRLCEINDISAIANLPCLETIRLKDNPICSILDYRTKVLEVFLDRSSEVTLDGIATTSKELNTVRVLVALQKAKLVSSGGNCVAANCSIEKSGSSQLSGKRNRTFTRLEVQQMMDSRDTAGPDDSSKPRPISAIVGASSVEVQIEAPDVEYKVCKSVKQTKNGLVMGLTGDVNMVDWSSLLNASNVGIDGSTSIMTEEERRCREVEIDQLRNLTSFLSSHVSSRTDCTQLFTFIVKKEEEKDPALLQTSSFLASLKDFLFKTSSGSWGGSGSDPFDSASSPPLISNDEGYPSFTLWEHLTKSNKSALATLPMSHGFKSLATCDPRKFLNAFHDVILCKPQEKEYLCAILWCYVQVSLMPYPKLAVIFVTDQFLRIYFDTSGGGSASKFFKDGNKSRPGSGSGKSKSLLNGRNLLPISEIGSKLSLIATAELDDVVALKLNATSQCVEISFLELVTESDKVNRKMVVATLEASEMQQFCNNFKKAQVNCELNLMDLKDSVQKKPDLKDHCDDGLQASPSRKHENRIFFASNLMKFSINEQIQSIFPMLILTGNLILCIKDPMVCSITQTKLVDVSKLDVASENSAELQESEMPTNSASDPQSKSGEDDNRLICVHKISQIVLLKMKDHSTSLSLSVRTFARSFDDLSASSELNFQDDFYDSSEQPKDASAVSVAYLLVSFRTMKEKERFMFLLQKRYEDIMKHRLSVISP